MYGLLVCIPHVLDSTGDRCHVYEGPWGRICEGCIDTGISSCGEGYVQYSNDDFRGFNGKHIWQGEHFDPQLFSPSLRLIPLLPLPLPSASHAPPYPPSLPGGTTVAFLFGLFAAVAKTRAWRTGYFFHFSLKR